MNKHQPAYRYPGAQPFQSDQQHLFFGREKDIHALYELISLEDLVVLYAKSGLGKSSLLNAGILPKVQKESNFKPFFIRFSAFVEGNEEYRSPLEQCRAHLKWDGKQQETFYLDKILPQENSLWYHAKNRQSASSKFTIPPMSSLEESKQEGQFLLVFDQFEELFTYPEADIRAFGQQLKELLNRQIPQRFRAILEQQFDAENLQLTKAELEALNKAFEVKIVMAIRSDRMSSLNKLKDYFPNILRHCYELDALSEQQAENAILQPAYQKGINFKSPIFDYEDEALDKILAFLTKNHSQKIESFQLQIVCEAIEKKVIEQKLSLVHASDIGKIDHIIEHHYDNNIAALGTAEEQLVARKLIEEALIFEEEERRLPLYEGQIYRDYGISPELLQKLVDSHLLRAEPSMQGGYTYELSHDTLVAPVLMAKERRKEAEEKQRLEEERTAREKELEEQKRQLELERERKAELVIALTETEEQRSLAQQKQKEAEQNERQAQQRTRIAFALLVAALLALGFAGWQYLEAVEARKITEEAKGELIFVNEQANIIAESALELQKKLLSERQSLEAQNRLSNAKIDEYKAKEQLAYLTSELKVKKKENQLTQSEFTNPIYQRKEYYNVNKDLPEIIVAKEAKIEAEKRKKFAENDLKEIQEKNTKSSEFRLEVKCDSLRLHNDNSIAIISGRIFYENNELIKKAQLSFYGKDFKTYQTMIDTTNAHCKYYLEIPDNREYDIQIQAYEGDKITSSYIEGFIIVCDEKTNLKKIVKKDFNFNSNFAPFLFKTSSSELSDTQDKKVLKNYWKSIITYLSNDNSAYLLIKGYADIRGSTKFNCHLSFERAIKTMEFLSSLGWPINKMKVIGMGEVDISKKEFNLSDYDFYKKYDNLERRGILQLQLNRIVEVQLVSKKEMSKKIKSKCHEY